MSIAAQPSKLSLPQSNPGVHTVLEYLILKFPYITAQQWQQRMNEGKVHCHDGSLITFQTPFKAQLRVYYYREVTTEPVIPFEESILFQDSQILVAYKPPFLPVTPAGKFVNECLQNRLRLRTGLADLQALHRLDRVTAGLVMFSVTPSTREQYHHLFATQKIQKKYQAIANIGEKASLVGQQWTVKNRIVRSQPRFCMQVVDGETNSHSVIRCVQQSKGKARFELSPITGKTHQLRLHMQTLGWPIENDKYYPILQPLSADNFAAPLQLLAKSLTFIDPFTQQPRAFSYPLDLSLSAQVTMKE